MKLIKVSFIIAVAVLALVGISATSYAFHDGGVARCGGCHTMHNSFQGTVMTYNKALTAGDPLQNQKFLLVGADQSSACLSCHGKGSGTSSYHVSTQSVVSGSNANMFGQQMTPGGDFSWVKINYKTAAGTGSGYGERHGHNIVATDFGYAADATNTTAPGATVAYAASALNCISCHDPHASARRDSTGTIVYRTATTFPPIMESGSYGAQPTAGEAVGVYRFLGSVGYKPLSYPAGPAFANSAPLAIVPNSYNMEESTHEVRTAYGNGMSEWCANCHDKFLNTTLSLGTGGHPHPAGAAIGASTSAIYNAYIKTGDMTGTDGYTSLVPVEVGAGAAYDATLLSYATSTPGNETYNASTAASVVMCLSCHRAHASGFDSMIRWYNSDAFITEDGAYTTSANGNVQNGNTQAQMAYYKRPETGFALWQRVLCNKCHAKD